jgi:hypothetical protein
MFPLTLLIAWSSSEVVRGEKIHFPLLGFWLAILYQFELAGFILLPIVAVALLWGKVKLAGKDISRFLLGGIIGLTPFIAWDLKQGVYLQTIGFLTWAAIKVWEGILGVFTGQRGPAVFGPAIEFFSNIISPSSSIFAILLLLLSLGLFVFPFLGRNKKLEFGQKFVLIWFFGAFFGFLLRGIYSEAYIPLLYFPTIIIFAFFLDWVIQKSGRAGWLFILVYVSLNSVFLVQHYTSSNLNRLTFSERLEVVDFIINNAQGKDYKLTYFGPGYMFHSGDNHWRYLLWWKGNEPEKDAERSFSIIEKPYSLSKEFNRLKDFGNVKVGIEEQ